MTQQTMMKQQTNNTNNQQHQQYHNNNETNNNETTAFSFLFSLENLEQQNSLGVVFSWVLLVYRFPKARFPQFRLCTKLM